MSPETVKQISDNACQLVVREYDNMVIAKRFVEVYEEVVGFR
jgi:hypothetical protein